mgnify:CR=1 FL=1
MATDEIVLYYKGHVIYLSSTTIRVHHKGVGTLSSNWRHGSEGTCLWGPEILSMEAINRARVFIDREFEKYEIW